MRMKKIKQYLGLILPMFVAIAMSSCIKDSLSENPGKVNVTLSLNTRAESGEAALNEGIKTLRVIIADNNNIVKRNIKKEYDDNETLKNLYIIGLEEGINNFYVVINEKSLGLNLDNWTPEEEYSVQNENSVFFPKSVMDVTDGVPATGKEQVNLLEGTDNVVSISCTYAVAKIVLNVTNNSGRDFAVKNVKFGPFFQQGTYLFNKDGKVPSENSKEHSFPLEDVKIPVTSESGTPTQALVCYLFETGQNISSDSYTIALDVDGMDFLNKPAPIKFDSNSLPRGYQLNLNAKVTGTEITYGPVTVEPWKEQNIELE